MSKVSARVAARQLLLIFYRNPELGKVKTRLAKAIGDERALVIYRKLSAHTRNITQHLAVTKRVCYSHVADTEDHWANTSYQKKVQHGNELGEKMHNAFVNAFADGYQSACIIGTDCLQLTSSIIENAFQQLTTHDAVIGPAVDGGYYLLGMNQLHPEIFRGKSWSTSSVCKDTISDFKNLKLSFSRLEMLSDIDNESDLLKSGQLL